VDTVPTVGPAGPLPHPSWCSPHRCTVQPGQGGTHVSEPIQIATGNLRLVLFLEASTGSEHTVVVTEVHTPGVPQDEPTIVPLRTPDAARYVEVLVHLLDAAATS
jgi:hypothetical protein